MITSEPAAYYATTAMKEVISCCKTVKFAVHTNISPRFHPFYLYRCEAEGDGSLVPILFIKLAEPLISSTYYGI